MIHDNNFLIDAFDGLSNCNTEDDIWFGIHKLLDNIGANHLATSEMIKKDQTFLWIRTSITDDWTEEYLANQYYLADPILQEGLMKSAISNIKSGEISKADKTASMLERRYRLGLKDAGYGEIRTQSFSPHDSGTSRFVTVFFEDNKDVLSHIDQAKVARAQSLISIFQNKPTSSNAPGLVKFGAHALTARERDVLSYLSQGMQTAEIAEKLGLAIITVNMHFRSAKKRLNAATREQALAIAMASGAVSL